MFSALLIVWLVEDTTLKSLCQHPVSARDNVAIKIFGMECIFGIRWTVAQIRPWILDTVELFGPDRCMFASHLPVCKLACSVQQLYAAYLEVIADFSVSEKRHMLHDTAAAIYGL